MLKLLPDPKNFGSMLVDIHENSKIALHIMDGITAMQGEGPTAGDVYNANKITKKLTIQDVLNACAVMNYVNIVQLSLRRTICLLVL